MTNKSQHGPEPITTNGYSDELGRLSQELQTWCRAQGLPWESACDLRHRPEITPAQWDWIADYIERWDAAENGYFLCPCCGDDEATPAFGHQTCTACIAADLERRA